MADGCNTWSHRFASFRMDLLHRSRAAWSYARPAFVSLLSGQVPSLCHTSCHPSVHCPRRMLIIVSLFELKVFGTDAISSLSLFSLGVRNSITIRLQRPVSLTSLHSAMSISSRSLILSPRKWKWTVTSIALVLITGVQTSWSVLSLV